MKIPGRKMAARIAALVSAAAVAIVLSSCVSTMALDPENPSEYSIEITTSTDHLNVLLEGVEVTVSSLSSINPKGIYTSIEHKNLLHVTPGPDNSQNGVSVTVVWEVTVAPGTSPGVLVIRGEKGVWGSLSVVVSGLGPDGKQVTNKFIAQAGGSSVYPVFRIPLKAPGSAK